ncbi:20734_t:CDS:2 [Entrophospora sp. SA101]|nr:20734_t:CDS:2 [Entrophospora sp. SA101]
MSKLQTICTEEELKMWTTVPGEIQAISTNRAQNEKINPFLRAKVGHKVDMKGTLIKTPSKFGPEIVQILLVLFTKKK